VSGLSPCAATAAYDLSGRPDGDYTFSAVATDPAGNTGDPASSTYTLAAGVPPVPPSVTITGRPSSPGNDPRPAWTFVADTADASFQCRLENGSGVLNAWAPCQSPKGFDLTGLADGTYTFDVRATNQNGTGDPASDTYVLDTTPPTVTITSRPTSPGSDTTPAWSFVTEPGATTRCRLADSTSVIDEGACTSSFQGALSGHPNGDYSFGVRATDPAGNTGPEATDVYRLAPVSTGSQTPPPTPGHFVRHPHRQRHHVRRHAQPPPPGRPNPPVPQTNSAIGKLIHALGTVASKAAKGAAFPGALAIVVFLFLTLQDRFDRSDPKLALAPVYPDRTLRFRSD
jgi:predicted phage tail protein